MDYEKKYKEALERMKSWARGEHPECFTEAQAAAEFIFPELKESEDENVRKELIDFVKSRLAGFPQCEKFISWLEKQGEKLPDGFYYVNSEGKKFHSDTFKYGNVVLHTEKQGKQKLINNLTQQEAMDIAVAKCFDEDEYKPKFHVGDWTVSNLDGKARQVSEVHFDEYNSYYVVNGMPVGLEEFNRRHRLWTIQDAKNGDVLVNGSNIFIFHFISGTRLMGYCHINIDDGRFYDDIGRNECFCLIDAVVNPATKEQRDTLFAKMREAGYEWDAEKKELRKIKNVSVWSEEDEQYLLVCKNALTKYQITDKWDANIIFHWLKNKVKSLRPQSTWKPSEEQMKALNDINLAGGIFYVGQGQLLIELYNDLKKLTE